MEALNNLSFKGLSNNDLIAKLKNLIKIEEEREAVILVMLKEVKYRKIYALAGYANFAAYCFEVLGLSEDMAWKRSKAVDTIAFFPWALDMLIKGETKVSQLAMLSSKITQANADLYKDFLPNKTKAELKAFSEKVQLDGTIIEVEEKIELKLRCKKDLIDKLHQARTLKASSKHLPDMEDLLESMVDLWLAKHDPIKRAERAAERQAKKDAVCTEANAEVTTPTHDDKPNCPEANQSRYIPAAIRHETILTGRDGCCYLSPEGKRCGSFYKLQIDHVEPYCFTKTHTLEKRVLCAVHNQFMADLKLGREFMDRKRQEVRS